MKFSFGNMMFELNILNIYKQLRYDDNEICEVDLTETLVEDALLESSIPILRKR